MARRAEPAAAATLDDCLAEARAGRARPVYLLEGDVFLALRGARALAEALVPEGQRSLNVVELDPAASPGEVAAEVATGGLFGGAKVVVAVEPAFLASREGAADAFAAAAKAWADGRQREGARRLLALAAKAGIGAKALALGEDGRVADEVKDALAEELGVALDADARAFVDAAARWARERGLEVARGDDASALDAALERGLPSGHVLVVAAGKVDGRLPLVKRLAAAGRRVPVGIANEGKPWEAPRLALGPVIAALLAGTGKRVDARGEARLAELVGDDARTLAQEVAKLAAYVGDRKVVGADDVDAVVTRVAADPFFALGNAVEARDLEGALAVLDRSIADGAHPVMLVAALASTVRRLVVERERARRAAGDRRIRDARDWEATVLPTVPEDEAKGKKPYGFWMKYQAAMRFGRDELLRGLAALADADLAMKSGLDGRIALERALVGLLGGGRDRERERSLA